MTAAETPVDSAPGTDAANRRLPPRIPASKRFTNVLVNCVLPAWFLASALFFAATTLCVILNFALRQPTFDQYKEYGSYLSQPFLTSVLMMENGHHPFFPALVANIEIMWFDGNQILQLVVGTLCLFLSVALIAWTAWRERTMPRIARSAGVMLAILGVLWLANARMLVQGVGQLQIYLVVLSAIIAISCTWQAACRDSWGWIAAATGACTVAMFTFGSGAASFPTVIVLGFLLRMRWQKLMFPLLAGVVCLFFYVFILPGHEGVRHSLALRPFESLIVIAQWLSSPWANAFFGLADPPLQPWMQATLTDNTLGRILSRTANGLEETIGHPWQSISMLCGLGGILVFLFRLVRKLAQRIEFTRYEILATGLCLFGLVNATIIGVGRLDYLQDNSNQVFADRYLAWPCLFWMALTLLLLSDIARLKNRMAAISGLLFLIALPAILFPSQRSWAIWADVVYQKTQQSAAAARSNVYDSSVFPNGADATRADVAHTLSLLKRGQVAMFADPSWKLLGSHQVAKEKSSDIVLNAQVTDTFQDPLSGLPSARIEGAVSHGAKMAARQGQLAILDENDNVVGLAEFSFISREADALRLNVPRKRGFDGYIHDYRAGSVYRLVLLRHDAQSALLLQQLGPRQ